MAVLLPPDFFLEGLSFTCAWCYLFCGGEHTVLLGSIFYVASIGALPRIDR